MTADAPPIRHTLQPEPCFYVLGGEQREQGSVEGSAQSICGTGAGPVREMQRSWSVKQFAALLTEDQAEEDGWMREQAAAWVTDRPAREEVLREQVLRLRNRVGLHVHALVSSDIEPSEAELSAVLDEGGDPNDQSMTGESALAAVCARGRLELAALLLSRGGNPNLGLGGHRAHSALMHAAYSGHTPLVRLLLSRGAEKDGVCSCCGKSALDWAREAPRPRTAIIELLSSWGGSAGIHERRLRDARALDAMRE